jgi:hypothetical protein
MLVSPRLDLISKRQSRNEWRQTAQKLAEETDSERFLELCQQLLRALDDWKFDA